MQNKWKRFVKMTKDRHFTYFEAQSGKKLDFSVEE